MTTTKRVYEAEEAELIYELDDTADDGGGADIVSAGDALVDCVNRIGAVDLTLMQAQSGIPAAMLIDELDGSAIFQDPAAFLGDEPYSIEAGWVLREEYLSGYLPIKLAAARHMNKRHAGHFERNIEVLERLMPTAPDSQDIHISLGATYVPAFEYAQFIKWLLRLREAPEVVYDELTSTWSVSSTAEMKNSVRNNLTYGIKEMPAAEIVKHTMNARTVKVYDYDYAKVGFRVRTERSLNRAATLAAQEKQSIIIKKFDEWRDGDADRAARFREYYCDNLVGYSFSPYDGSFLHLPGLSPDVKLFAHQKNAIARIVLSKRNLLLAHDVGAGKTYELIVGIHELWRMGLSKKNLIVVPNSVLTAFEQAHRMLYPDDDILVIYPSDFTLDARNSLLRRIREGGQVAVYMAFSSFDLVAMSKAHWVKKYQSEIRELRRAAVRADRQSALLLEAKAKACEKKLEKYTTETEESPFIPYDELGITTLAVDEIHNYKNIDLASRSDNIVGMHSKGSKKCIEMLEKCQFTPRILLASGTPLTNSIADLYTLQVYLQPEELRFRRLGSFDMWINTFGERSTNFEIDIDGAGLRAMTRFSTFHNLNELMGMFSSVCDFYHIDAAESGLPEFNGYRDICVPKNEVQAEYIADLAERCERIRAHAVSRAEDNLLKVTGDGRKCALDARLVCPDAVGTTLEGSKIAACAREIAAVYFAHPGKVQAVFSDIGTPKSEFNVYDCLRDELISLGVREREIAYIHDATTDRARERLFERINAADVRVVIASTSKMGQGVNIQKNLIALHHLSIPWKPAEMVQREGRILRRGNECREVYIYRYITAESFDSYSWQILENKQRFIESFLSGTAASRDIDDISDSVLSYAEVKALAIGNPLVKARVETQNRLGRLQIASRQRQKQLLELRAVVERTPSTVERLTAQYEQLTADSALYASVRETVPSEERLAFGEELLCALAGNCMRERERLFGDYLAFSVYLPADMSAERQYVELEGESGGRYYVEMDTDKPLGCSRRIDFCLDSLEKRADAVRLQALQVQKQCADAEADLEVGNPYTDEIEKLEHELAEIDEKLSAS